MELKIDLLKIEKKSKFRIIIGISGIIIFIAWVIVKIHGDKLFKLEFLDWLFALVILINGVTHTTEGFGFSISSLFGQSFINIDEQSIIIKIRLFEKEQHFEWSGIKAMEYMTNKYSITMKDGTPGILNLSKLEYLHKQEVKSIIEEIAATKGVLINS